MPGDRHTVDTITSDALDQLYAERDDLHRRLQQCKAAGYLHRRSYDRADERARTLATALLRLDEMATAWQQQLPDTIRTKAAADAVHATVRAALASEENQP